MTQKKKTTKGKQSNKARDEKFVDLVAKGESATDAYKEAGFKTSKNAGVNAHQKLNNPKISEMLEKRKAEFRAMANVEARDIVGAQQQIAFASIEDALDDDGELDFAKAKLNGSANLIKRISRRPTKFGQHVTVEFYSRSDALSQLADLLGLKQKPRENDDTIAKWREAISKLLTQGVVDTRKDAVSLLKSVGFEGLDDVLEASLLID